MSKSILITAILAAFIVGGVVGAGGYYAYTQSQPIVTPPDTIGNQPPPISDAEKKAQLDKYLAANYPDTVSGTLILSGTFPTIKTAAGKIYLLWPTLNRATYERNGFTDGQQVQMQGKILPKDEKMLATTERLAIYLGGVVPK